MDILMLFGGLGVEKTKPNKAKLLAVGRKSEIRSSKFEIRNRPCPSGVGMAMREDKA